MPAGTQERPRSFVFRGFGPRPQCLAGLMLEGVAVQGFGWSPMRLFFGPLAPHDQPYERSGALNHVTSYMLGEESHPRGKVPPYNTCPQF